MKPLDIVTVLRQGKVASPGIVLTVTEADGRRPSLKVGTVLEGGDSGLMCVPIDMLPHAEDDPHGTYTWIEYNPGDFEPDDVPASESTEPAAGSEAGSTTTPTA